MRTDYVMRATTRAFLESRLGDLVARGRAAWPELAVSDERFLAYVAERLPDDVTAEDALGLLSADELYLACAAAGGDPRAGAAIRERCQPRIAAALASVGLADAIDETAQQVFADLLLPDQTGRRGIESYRGTGELAAFVKVIALRSARRARKRQGRERPMDHDALVERAAQQIDPELEGLKQRYRQEFKAAFHEALATLSDRERNILRYELIGGLNIDQIGGLYDVHRATVARWRSKAREKLLVETHGALKRMLGVSPTELESIVRLIDSQLDVSLTRALRAAEE